MAIIVDYVADPFRDTGAGTAALTLGGGQQFVASTLDARYGAWRNIAERQHRQGYPVYVDYDPGTRIITDLYQFTLRNVESVRASGADRTRITFLMAPSRYYLMNNRPGSDRMRILLEQARVAQQKVLVAVHPSTNEVLEVWAAPPQ
jgi:hypothetical protein